MAQAQVTAAADAGTMEADSDLGKIDAMIAAQEAKSVITQAAEAATNPDTDTTAKDEAAKADDVETMSVDDLRKAHRETLKKLEESSSTVTNLNKLKDKWGNEMGEIRKMLQSLPQLQQQHQPETQDSEFDGSELITKPVETVRKIQAKLSAEQQSQQQKQMLQTQLRMQQNREYLDTIVPDHSSDEVLSATYEAMKADHGGVAPIDLQTWRNVIYNESPGVVVNMVKRVKAEKNLAALQKKLDAAETKYKQLVDHMDGSAGPKSRPMIGGANGGATARNGNGAKRPIGEISLDALAEINALLGEK